MHKGCVIIFVFFLYLFSFYFYFFVTTVMHIISVTDFSLFCSKMPYSAGAYSARKFCLQNLSKPTSDTHEFSSSTPHPSRPPSHQVFASKLFIDFGFWLQLPFGDKLIELTSGNAGNEKLSCCVTYALQPC